MSLTKLIAADRLRTAVFLLTIVSISSVCRAQNYRDRAGRYELYGAIQQFEHAETGTSDTGTEIRFDDTINGGLGVGYNFDNHLNINVDLIFGQVDADFLNAGVVTGELGSVDTITLLVNLDYNLFETAFTPLITVGGGLFDSTKNEHVVPGELAETDLSGAAGIGFRWDVTDRFFIKGIYRSQWTRFHDFDDLHRFETVTIYLGVMF